MKSALDDAADPAESWRWASSFWRLLTGSNSIWTCHPRRSRRNGRVLRSISDPCLRCGPPHQPRSERSGDQRCGAAIVPGCACRELGGEGFAHDHKNGEVLLAVLRAEPQHDRRASHSLVGRATVVGPDAGYSASSSLSKLIIDTFVHVNGLDSTKEMMLCAQSRAELARAVSRSSS